MKLKDFKVGQVWRRRDGENVTITHIWPEFKYPVQAGGESCNAAGGWSRGGKPSPYDLVELVKDVDEPRAQTRLDTQLADAMQARRGATTAELALFDAIMITRAHDIGDIQGYALSVLQLRRKLEQDISQ